MMRKLLSSLSVMAVVIGGSAILAAQSNAPTPTAPATYNRSMETTVGGTITEVISEFGADGAVGIHAIVKTSAGLVNVQIGPATYIGASNFFFLTDDRVAIVGAKVSRNGATDVWARSVTKDGRTLVLRDEDGTPRWTATGDDPDGCGVSHDISR
jgi:hypothetical protein